MAGLNDEPRLLPCCLYPTPPPLRSCNPARRWRESTVALLFLMHTAHICISPRYAHFMCGAGALNIQEGDLSEMPASGALCAADGAAALRCRKEGRMEVG